MPCFLFVLSLPHTSKTTPMKATMLTLILFFTSLYFCSCSEHRYPRVLLTADSLAQTSPDSALSLLKQLKDSIGREPEETRMYYHLLCTKAQDIPRTASSGKWCATTADGKTRNTCPKRYTMQDGCIVTWGMRRRHWSISREQ